jgi:hypothetical protein
VFLTNTRQEVMEVLTGPERSSGIGTGHTQADSRAATDARQEDHGELENEILREAVEYGRAKKWIAHLPLLPEDDQ